MLTTDFEPFPYPEVTEVTLFVWGKEERKAGAGDTQSLAALGSPAGELSIVSPGHHKIRATELSENVQRSL